MKAATLQEFLRKLSAPLGALGVPQSSAALEACANALEPFKGLELTHLANFLQRAEEARRSEAVPLVEVAKVAPVSALARKLGEDVLAVESAQDGTAQELERQINLHRHQFQAALAELAQQFGITAKCSETPNWVPLVRAKKLVEGLKAQITSPESYQLPAVADAQRQLTELGDPVLKQLAGELGMPAVKVKGAKITEEILAHATTHRPLGAKPTKAPKAGPDPTELIRVLKEKVELVNQNPHALADAEVDELMERFKKFPVPQKKAIVEGVTGAKAKDGTDALLRIKSALIGLRQRLDSQNA